MKKHCAVCGDEADSNHFGAISCRACAAFFRRKVASHNRIIRRCDRKCVINSQMRKLCASCRFEQCLQVGMRESEVLIKIYDRSKFKPENAGVAYLKRIELFYTHLENIKKCEFIRRRNDTPKLTNYKIFNEVFKKYADIILDNICLAFPEVQRLADDQKKILFNNFITIFIIMEGSFKSKNAKIWILPNEDFIDDDQAEKFYQNSEDDQEGHKIYEVTKSLWKSTGVNLRSRMEKASLDKTEFLLLSAIVFWDGGLPNQPDDVTDYCQENRQKIIQELTSYENAKHSISDASFRVAEIIMMLQGIQTTIFSIHKSSDLSFVYSFEHHRPVYDSMGL